MTGPSQLPILVTGCRGQLGRQLCLHLAERAQGIDRPEFDLTDPESMDRALSRFRPAVVINAAAYTQVDRAEQEADLCRAVNALGVERLVEACRRWKARLVQISTDYVFDGTKAAPYVEIDPPNPLNVYGHSKWEAERAAAALPGSLVIRTAGLFGPPGPSGAGNFVETMLRLADEGKRLRVVSDQFASPTFTGDLARAIDSLLACGAEGVYHVTNGGLTSWHGLARAIFETSGRAAEIQAVSSADYAAAARRPAFSALSCRKYHGIAGCHPMPPWREALATYLKQRASAAGR